MFGSFRMQQVVGFEDPESVWKHPLKVRGHPFLDLPGGGVRLDDSEIKQIPMPDVAWMPYVCHMLFGGLEPNYCPSVFAWVIDGSRELIRSLMYGVPVGKASRVDVDVHSGNISSSSVVPSI